MPIGPKITDNVRRTITEVWVDHQDWVAKEVMTEVHTRLRKNNPNVKPNWPGISAIQIELKKLRGRDSDTKEKGDPLNLQDKPWNVITLMEYDLPPEALPTVLEVWLFRLRENFSPLTIREAKWVARLHKTVSDIQRLDFHASRYAFTERIGWLNDISLTKIFMRSQNDIDSFIISESHNDADLYGHMKNVFVEIDLKTESVKIKGKKTTKHTPVVKEILEGDMLSKNQRTLYRASFIESSEGRGQNERSHSQKEQE
jgi:hypothetical protein